MFKSISSTSVRYVRNFTSKTKRGLLLQDTDPLKTYDLVTDDHDKLRTYVWGLSRTGALGINTSVKQHEDYFRHIVHHPTRLQFAENTDITDVTAGYGFSAFAVDRSDGETVFGTGLNTDAQLGLQQKNANTLDVIIYPTAIQLPRKENERSEDLRVQSLSAGRAHLAIVTVNGTVFMLGNNSYGQCARRIVEDEVYRSSGIINRIDKLGDEDDQAQTVECGQDHTLFQTRNGKVWACGWGADGQTGTGSYESIGTPALIKGEIENERIIKVSSRADCVLALNDKGEIFGWGNSEYGQLTEADADTMQFNTPRHIEKAKGLGKIIDIAAGGSFCLILNEHGDVFSWGYGILGFGPNVEQRSEPTLLPAPLFGRTHFSSECRVVSIHCGIFHMGAVNSDGDLFMWGKNRFGCLGLGHKKDQYFPFKTAVNAKVVKVSCGVDHTIALCKSFV